MYSLLKAEKGAKVEETRTLFSRLWKSVGHLFPSTLEKRENRTLLSLISSVTNSPSAVEDSSLRPPRLEHRWGNQKFPALPIEL